MTFRQRALKMRLTMREGALSDGVSSSVELTGHRAEAVITNPGGGLSVGLLALRVFGMKLSDMNSFSTDGLNALAVRGDSITVSAGDVGGRIQQVFDGTITSAYIDFGAQPEVSFNVQAQAGFLYKVRPAPPNSYEGTVDAALVIESLAKSIGFAFENNQGVSRMLSNQYLSGSVIEQIHAVANAAGIAHSIENGVVAIWPADGTRSDQVVQLAPGRGLVGYPSFTPTGIAVRAEFNPDVVLGSWVEVDTSLAKAKGKWRTQAVTHELSTLMPGGPWFSTCQLTKSGLYVARN